MEEELGEYLGRQRYEREGGGGSGGLSEWFLPSASVDGDWRSCSESTPKPEGVCDQGIGGVSEEGSNDRSVDHGLFCFRDEYKEGVYYDPFFVMGADFSTGSE